MERVLGSDPEVRVFDPQYLTCKGKVLGQLWYPPTSKTILIDLMVVMYAKNAEKFCGHGKFDVIVDTYLKLWHLWTTSPMCKCFQVEFYADPCPTCT